MPSIEGDASRDGERYLKHQHSSSSDTGRAMVPMWDSSDPERAPPPLPMNPSSPLTSTSRPNTSSAIQSAHLALTEKARESGYITNPPIKRLESPERSLIKGAAHKRMQSLQTGSVRDLSNFIEGGSTFGSRSPEKASIRPSTPHSNKDFFLDGKSPEKSPDKEARRSVLLLEASSPEKDSSRCSTPTPHDPPARDTPTLRPSLRRPPQSILGENTPPQSATMLALQSMASRDADAPLSNITNGSTALVRTPQTFDAISNQILSLTSIATALQREMAQLSRRSKDNATDLVSLKEATNARDEDIRKSLRELCTGLNDHGTRPLSYYGHGSGHGSLYIDNKAHGSPNSSRVLGSPNSSSNAVKPFILPRIPSPNSFAESLNRESIGSPCVYNPEGMASIAILEKISREMGTKETQELLLSKLQSLSDSYVKSGSVSEEKLDALMEILKSNTTHAMVSQNNGVGNGVNTTRPRDFSFGQSPSLDLDFDYQNGDLVSQRSGPLLSTSPNKENTGSIVSDETLKIIRTIKDSVAQGGGLTAEVKALVRELRGEVLGMGREMGRKIDQATTDTAKAGATDKEKIARVVQDGLDTLKEHLDQILHEHRQQSTADTARNAIDYQEIYQALRSAINEDHETRSPGLEKEDIILAVKEAWENYKPDIEVQHFGLEREELLTVLKSGIQEYAPTHEAGATRDEVFTAVIEGFKHFPPPQIEPQPSLTREEIQDAVRDCLEEFEFPSAPAPEPLDTGITRDEMLDAIREGLHNFDFAANTTAVTRDVGETLTRNDMLDAVKEGLVAHKFPNTNTVMSQEVNETITKDDIVTAVMEGLHAFDFGAEVVNQDDMLNAVKEGLLGFDFPSGASSRDDIIDAVKETLLGFDFPTSTTTISGEAIVVLRDEVATAVKEALESTSYAIPPTRDDMRDAIKEGLETFDFASGHSTALTRALPDSDSLNRDDVLDAVKEALHNFDFPTNIEPTNHVDRDEIIDAVTHSLRSFDFAANSTALVRDSPDSLSHEAIVDAVTQSLRSFDFAANTTALSREVSGRMERDEIVEAVQEALHSFDFMANTSTALTRDVGASLTKEDVYDAIKAGIEDTPQVHNAHVNHDEIMDAVKASLDAYDFPINSSHALTRGIDDTGLTRDDVYEAVKAGIESTPQINNAHVNEQEIIDAVKAGLASFDFPSSASNLSSSSMDSNFNELVQERLEEIIDLMKTEFKAVSEEAKQNVAANGRDTEQLLDATKDGFERLRGDVEKYVDRAIDINGKDELLDRMRQSFDALRTEVELLSAQGSNSSLDVVRGELESFRETMNTSVVPRNAGTDKDELLEVLKQGLDSIREEVDRPKDSNESIFSGTGEILDALHDGLNAVRTEVESLGNKPVDMTVNYEILDTLKLGLEGIRADIDRLRENQDRDGTVAAINSGAVVTAAEGLKRNDIENLEVLITQLRIKVEALESMPPPIPQPVPGSLSREDLEPVHEMLRNVHESVSNISGQSRSVDEESPKREDIEAIETLLRNTKAKIDEMNPEEAVKKEHLDAVEVLILETRETLMELATQLEDVSKRDDVNTIEGLVRDVLASLQEVKDKAEEESTSTDKVTKTDVEAVEAVCHDIKAVIEQQIMADIANLASKDDFKNMEEMVKEFKGRVELHEENNAKAFEERQAETVGVGERVSEIKELLQDFKDSLKSKLEEGSAGVDDLANILEGLGETVNKNGGVIDIVKEMFEAMKTEFEQSNAGVVGSKIEADEKFQVTWDKFDSKFDDLVTRYEGAQAAAEILTKLGEERSAESEAALLAAKNVAEEVKLLIDTLGTTLTDSIEKMDEASKTVFNRVDETFTRVEETHADAKAEHQLTREQVFKTLHGIEGVQVHVAEHTPKILDSLKDVLAIVGQHYEHSKESSVSLQEKIAERAVPPEVPLLNEAPVEKYDDSQVHEKLDRLVEKSDFTQIHEKLDKLVDSSDCAPVHEKLDKLVDHTETAEKSFAQLAMLDQIHQQVMKTAAEVSDFVSNQTQRIANDHEDKEKAVEEATIALEKRLAQKEHAEATVVGLREEEERLKESVAILRAEQEDLAHQKLRLSADVSSLETALRIRREELHAMEAQAEGLERRILEGVIDHSRALLVNRGNKGRDAMSRKRVPSHATSTTGSVSSYATSKASQSTQSAVSMAMSGKRAVVSVPTNNPAASRRILSLNQITHNVPTGNFKRSHSVKAPSGAGALRKSSWGGSLSQKYGDLNKENLALKESEEDEQEQSDGGASDTGTLRRSSRGTTIMTGTGVSESIDESTEWTGSSISGSEDYDPDPEDDNEEPDSAMVVYEEGGQLV